MNEYVLDTHALLWHFFATKKLGDVARKALAQVDEGTARAWIPAVVAAEALMVAQKRRIDSLTPERLLPLLEQFQDAENYRLCPLLPETVLRSNALDSIPDIFDRLVVAEALDRKLPLVTRDPVILSSGLVQTVWA